MVAQHTPTPWMSHSIGDMSPAEIRDLNEPTVAHCGDYCITIAGARGYDLHRSDAEDAAFICLAANTHDALVAALEEARIAMHGYLEDHPHSPPYDCYATGPKTGDAFYDLVRCPGCTAQNSMTSAISRIDAALALAKPEQMEGGL